MPRNIKTINELAQDAFYSFNTFVLDENTFKRDINDSDMVKALTVVREMEELGFTLTAKDTVDLAHYDMTPVMDVIHKLESLSGYSPMYKDFPSEVLSMDEATFRFHQMVHYYSTYGMEEIFGVECPNGWMPPTADTKKVAKQSKLLDLKPVTLSTVKELDSRLQTVLGKSERFTSNEEALILKRYENLDFSNIPFKENIAPIVKKAIEKDLKESKEGLPSASFIMSQACKHSGDVLDVFESYLTEQRDLAREKELSERSRDFYTRGRTRNEDVNQKPKNKGVPTRVKKAFVRALESSKNFELNMCEGQERNKYLLNAMSFGVHAKDKQKLETVKKLRNGELRSWESVANQKIKEHAPDAISFIGKRPGVLFRRAAELYRKGFDKDEIISELKHKDFKVQSIISAMNYFGQSVEAINNKTYSSRPVQASFRRRRGRAISFKQTERTKDECDFMYELSSELLKDELESINSSIRGKKVFVDKQGFDLEHSLVNPATKNLDNGYYPSGLAFTIPEEAKVVRFFCFWDDRKKRVDLDLHCNGKLKDGRPVDIGWNSSYVFRTDDDDNLGVVTSGDITTSENSAEYIDVPCGHHTFDGEEIKSINARLDYFNPAHRNGGWTFSDISKAFVGAMAVDKIGKNVKVYSPENCFMFLDLKNSKQTSLSLMDIYPAERFMRVPASVENSRGMPMSKISETKFNLQEYVKLFAESQNVVLVDNKEDADVILCVSEVNNDDDRKKSYSLIENNYGLNETQATIDKFTELNKELEEERPSLTDDDFQL